jgi:cell cycle checkpoint control protein RAD9A
MSLKLVLGPGQIRHFKNALRCLGGIGPELLLEAVPERVILRALNPAKSAFLSITFTNTFFESFMVFDSALVQASVLMKVRAPAVQGAPGPGPGR